MVDDALKSLVGPYLEKGERLQWAARPKPRRYMAGSLGAALFGLPFFSFAVFWELGVLGVILNEDGRGPQWFMAVFGIPFILIGAGLLFAPLAALLKFRRTVYAVTDRRALLVLTGSKGEVRGYEGHDFTAIQTKAKPDGSGDVFFAADTGVERFLIESGAGKGGPFSKVGFFGVPRVAEVQRLLEALKREPQPDDALESRRSTTSEARLDFKGAYEASQTKFESFLTSREQQAAASHRQAWARYRSWVAGFALLFAAGVFTALTRGAHWDDIIGFGIFFGFILAAGTGIGFYAVKMRNTRADEEIQRGQSLRLALERLAADAHPKTKIHGWVDLGEARTTRPYRMANSFSSGALKTYHKHHWVRLVFATADGSKLAVSVVDRVKFKSGNEVTRSRQVRGRLEVNADHYDTRRLSQRFSAGSLEILGIEQHGKTVLYFGGTLEDPATLPDQLAALYRLLPHPVQNRV